MNQSLIAISHAKKVLHVYEFACRNKVSSKALHYRLAGGRSADIHTYSFEYESYFTASQEL